MASKKNSTATTEQLPSGIVFRQPHAGAPAALVADVEVPIHRGPLAGLKVTGVTIWRRHADGELFVRFPSRPDGEKSWEHIRANDGRRSTVDTAKAGILAAYKAAVNANGVTASAEEGRAS